MDPEIPSPSIQDIPLARWAGPVTANHHDSVPSEACLEKTPTNIPRWYFFFFFFAIPKTCLYLIAIWKTRNAFSFSKNLTCLAFYSVSLQIFLQRLFYLVFLKGLKLFVLFFLLKLWQADCIMKQLHELDELKIWSSHQYCSSPFTLLSCQI